MPGGFYKPVEPYELSIDETAVVVGCAIDERIIAPADVVSAERNRLTPLDPRLDERFVPRAPGFEQVGYRPLP
jgi:hypothetical protein